MKILPRPTSMLAATLLLLVGCYTNNDKTSSESPMQKEVQEVTISIDQHQGVYLNGEQTTLPVLEMMLADLAAKSQIRVTVRVAPNTPMGLVSDVRQRIPATTAKVLYPLPEE